MTGVIDIRSCAWLDCRLEETDRAEQRLRMWTDGRGLGSKLVSFAKRFSKHPHILAIFKVDSEYLRFPFKVKVDYFILYSILVYSFVIFLIFFCYETKKTHERSSSAKLVSFAKGCSKWSLHFAGFYKVVSEYLRFPFNVKVGHFILHSILVYSFVIFLIFFAMSKRRCTYEAERLFPTRMLTCLSENRNERRLINMWSVPRNRPGIQFQCQH